MAQRAVTEFGIPNVSVLLSGDDAVSLRQALESEAIRPLNHTPLDLELWNRRLRRRTATIAPVPERTQDAPLIGEPGEADVLPLLVRRRGEVMPLIEAADLESDDEVLGLVPEEAPRRAWRPPAPDTPSTAMGGQVG